MRLRGLVAVFAAVTVIVSVTGCAGASQRTEVHTLRGTVTLNPAAIGTWTEGQPCGGGGGYDDLHGGAAVVVRDAAGVTVAQMELQPGELQMSMVSDTELSIGGRPEPLACRLHFTGAVPAGSDFYGVTVGNRPEVPLTADDMGQELLLATG